MCKTNTPRPRGTRAPAPYVPGCGNEVHTYCTLANPIEEFTCPRCVEKKSLTKHPSLDARIAARRAGEEFKY